MSEENPNKPVANEDRQTEKETLEERGVDPRDLVSKGGFTKDPREIVNNPAVTPQMLNEPGDLRDDLTR